MARAHPVPEIDFEEAPIEPTLKSLRRNLNQLRRQAHELDQTALENCLSLAISLTSPRFAKDDC